jgi:putative sporulation protein YyaC
MLENLFKIPLRKTPAENRFNVNQPNAMLSLGLCVRDIVRQAKIDGQPIIVLCIGTDRSTGDALGPLIGSKLCTFNMEPTVYGTLDEPVHATNLVSMLTTIEEKHSRPFIIAVDACLGKLENIGYISLGHGSVKPGAAVNKVLPSVGNAYITGVVNVGGFMEHLVLQSTRLNLVMKMADTIAHALSFGLKTAK